MKRQCGECTLCCKLLPVPELHKPAGARCQHQRAHKGCAIYASRPFACRVWTCAWLSELDAAGLSRPDRAHYVIDLMPDFIVITYEDEPPRKIPVIQVWIDPKYPQAHRDPALRAFLARRGELDGMAAIIRYDDKSGFCLFPPALADGEWREEHSQLREDPHSAEEIVSAVFQGG